MREISRRRQVSRRKSPALIFALDILCAGLLLLVFAYFHHVNPIRSNMDPVALPKDPVVNSQEPQPSQSHAVDTSKFLSAGQAPIKTENTYITEHVNVAVRTEKINGETCHIAEIYVSDVTYLKTYMAGDSFSGSWNSRALHEELSKEAKAFVSINGDQMTQRNNGIVVRNGVLYRTNEFGDVCLLKNDGTLVTIPQHQFDVSTIESQGVWQAWGFGPMLLNNGQVMSEFNSTVATKGNPRTAIGMIEPLHYLFIAVEGRQESDGMTCEELSQLFYDLGCTAAYNMDGGATSSMCLNGSLYSSPSDSRKVTDIIYIGLEE